MSSHNKRVEDLRQLLDFERLAQFVAKSLDTDKPTARTAVKLAAWDYMGSITNWVRDIEDRKPKKRKPSL